MGETTMQDVREFFSTPDRPVTAREIRDLTPEDRTELKTLIAAQ